MSVCVGRGEGMFVFVSTFSQPVHNQLLFHVCADPGGGDVGVGQDTRMCGEDRERARGGTEEGLQRPAY